MKRKGYLHEQVYNINNINCADLIARKHKKKHYGIRRHDKNAQEENERLAEELKDLTYTTSLYTTFTVHEPKERIIFRLPYYPDRIAHHAIMNVLEPIFVKNFIKYTYACIKGRGIHKLANDIKKVLRKYPDKTTYCLKLDILKFYPSIDHNILMKLLRKKIKDKKLLKLLQEIVDSADGVPIGNYLSQFLANFFLSILDHWLKEEVKCKFYFRYSDDIVILDCSKEHLRNILIAIKIFLKYVLNLKIKQTYLIFPVDSRGIDFVGYRFYHTHTLLRKSIKRRIFKLINKYKHGVITNEELNVRMLAYFGWLKYCNSKHLLDTIYKLTGIYYSNWVGIEDKISNYYNKIIFIVNVQPYSKYFKINFVYNNKSISVKSRNWHLKSLLDKLALPTNYKILKYDNSKLNNKYRKARCNN